MSKRRADTLSDRENEDDDEDSNSNNSNNIDDNSNTKGSEKIRKDSSRNPYFREVPEASRATALTDGVRLATPQETRGCSKSSSGNGSSAGGSSNKGGGDDDDGSSAVIMPWMGFGTYRIGGGGVERVVLQALQCGYRLIDTAFIYAGETCEASVGRAIQIALDSSSSSKNHKNNAILQDRSQLFVTTKHWRSYHGYEPSLKCLKLSLQRLQLEYVDLWLMHWPGPAWKKKGKKETSDADEEEETEEQHHDPRWSNAQYSAHEMATRVRAETWRAMEDAYRQGKTRAIGVSNFTVKHLQLLKQTATLWPPAVNQVELHPLHPQTELLEYCQQEGIVVQAYASLGGQDMGKAAWKTLLGSSSFVVQPSNSSIIPQRKHSCCNLLHAKPVVELATQLEITPAQVLLRWAIEKGCAVIPKASTTERMMENANVVVLLGGGGDSGGGDDDDDGGGGESNTHEDHVRKPKKMGPDHAEKLSKDLLYLVTMHHPELVVEQKQEHNQQQLQQPDASALTRLCWRSDPLRLLDFD